MADRMVTTEFDCKSPGEGRACARARVRVRPARVKYFSQRELLYHPRA